LCEEKDQKVQDLYDIISSMGEKLTDLIKSEAIMSKENNKIELQEMIDVRFNGFEKQMMQR